ncbi:hypothetical protein CBR_g4878 [Chara braunii]|uniref:Uncharacterized protein n=1 Tax=Chara braunii TaxID=69332 RepID=A0A388KJ19_CHABU|nr:hypothetical protein CBR_g4878 [Chara braunii]|eukprot:GBG70050.1 hypothetical protein CBR_g4878 [Chara braunii]
MAVLAVVSLLQKYLGNYVRGISVEALKISVWAGDVLLNNLQLKAEALNALNLPIVVKAGFLGSIRLKVPWNRLGQEPVIVLLDRIFLLAEPAQDDWLRTSEDETARLQAKFRRIDEAELAMLEAKEKKTLGADATPESKSWLQSLISTVIGNLKLSITNVHIRYEDTVSNPGHPFCTGITLASLAAVTVDERGIETFLAHGVMDKLRKVSRNGIASDCAPINIVTTKTGTSTTPYSKAQEERAAPIFREKRAKMEKELICHAKKFAQLEEAAAKKKQMEEEMKKRREQEAKLAVVEAEAEAAAAAEEEEVAEEVAKEEEEEVTKEEEEEEEEIAEDKEALLWRRREGSSSMAPLEVVEKVVREWVANLSLGADKVARDPLVGRVNGSQAEREADLPRQGGHQEGSLTNGVNLDKCEFGRTKILYLGHEISADGLRPDDAKVASIRDWPRPQTVTEVRSFLGMTSYYRSFVKNYSTIASPLTDLTRLGTPWEWTEECEASFKKLKYALEHYEVLKLPDPDKPFVVTTDASQYGIGAVLAQQEGPKLRPIEYMSKKMPSQKLAKSTYERELYALYRALVHWRHYLLGRFFYVRSDHETLRWIKTQLVLSDALKRWIQVIDMYDYQLDPIKGTYNKVADALSRRADCLGVLVSKFGISDELSRSLVEAYQGDPVMSKIIRRFKAKDKKTLDEFTMVDNLLFLDKAGNKGLCVTNSESLRSLFLGECHDATGHFGYKKTAANLVQRFWWPFMMEDAKQYVETSQVCQRDKPRTQAPLGLIKPLPIPEGPGQSVSMDFMDTLVTSKSEKRHIFVIVDRFTKYARLIAMPETAKTDHIIKLFMDNWVRDFGLHTSIVSDRDVRFTSELWQSTAEQMGTKLQMTSGNRPESNGQAKQMNRVVQHLLRHYIKPSQDDWDEKLPLVASLYNNVVHSTTGMTPNQLHLGWKPRSALDFLLLERQPTAAPGSIEFAVKDEQMLQQAVEHIQNSQDAMIAYENKHRRPSNFQDLYEEHVQKRDQQSDLAGEHEDEYKDEDGAQDDPILLMSKMGVNFLLEHGNLVRLDRFAIYHDSNHEPWKIDKDWAKLTPREWSEIFEPGIRKLRAEVGSTQWDAGRQYLLQPLGGTMTYVRHGKQEKREPGDPFHRVALTVEEVSLTPSEAQYCDAMKLLENFTNFRIRMNYSDLRPHVPVLENPKAWWQYAAQAALRQRRQISPRMQWENVYRLCQLRKKYVPLYVSLLQSGGRGDHPELRAMEAELDEEVVLLWRMVAHMQVERTKSKAAANARKDAQKAQKQSWLSWAWGGGGGAQPEGESSTSEEHENAKPIGLSKEEWDKLYELINYEPSIGLAPGLGQDPPHMMQIAVKLDIVRFAVELVDSGGQVVGGAFENLSTEVEIFSKMIRCSLGLVKYGLSAPEGQLIQSIKRSGREDALIARFVYSPLDEPFDWKLNAAIAPCYITVWRKTYDRLTSFLKSSEGESPGVAFETAAALQSKLEEVQRSAQEQLQLALQEQSRFFLDLDIDAPKLSIPADMSKEGPRGSQLLVDLGHFRLQTSLTEPEAGDPADDSNLYMQFKITGSDISAFIVDGEYSWSEERVLHDIKGPACLAASPDVPSSPDASSMIGEKGKTVLFLPVLDKCGMTVTFQQIRVAHPSVPSTRIAARLPSLGFHFSPARYHRLMQIMAVLGSDDKPKGPSAALGALPWLPPSFSGYVQVLQWEGISKTTACWERRYAVLSGAYLYILQSENSRTYLRYTRLTGKVMEVPQEYIAGYNNVIAVSNRGMDYTKVAESVHAIIMRLPTNELKETWMSNLTMALYKTSGHVSLSLLEGEEENEDGKSREQPSVGNRQLQENAVEGVSVYLIGVLDELKISISGKSAREDGVWSDEECELLELHACGSKVELRQREFDMSIGIGLHSLQFHDKLFGPSKVLASSVIAEPLSEEDVTGGVNSAVAMSCVENMQKGLVTSCSSDPSAVPRSADPESRTDERVDEVHHVAKESGQGGGEPGGGDSQENSDDDDNFVDATGEFESLPSSPTQTRFSDKESIDQQILGQFGLPGKLTSERAADLGQFGLPGKLTSERAADLSPPSFSKAPGLLDSPEEKSRAVDFVKMVIFMCQTDSPDYDDTDMEVKIQLATLDFFLNRPVIAALMEFGGHLGGTQNEPVKDELVTATMQQTTYDQETEKTKPETECIRGLLGRGKARVVFRLFMAMDSARIHLNLEDGSELALFSQDRLQTDIKVYPASFSVDARLGNLRVCDSALGESNPWYWMCDMNDEGKDSLIQLELTSYSKEEDDYPGYDYQLNGALSAVRIVFLYRFIQELMAYFLGLVTAPQVQNTVKVVDKVRGIERLIEQSEMEGGLALKLDVSMENPVIIVPSSSNSSDFMQLKPGHMKLSNHFEWRGGDQIAPEAVHLDIMKIQIEDANFMVGFGGLTQQPMVQDMVGLKVMLRRPLRDLFHAVPSMEIDVQMDKLRAVMSNKEYDLITQCASSNFAEEPKLPADFRQPSYPPSEHGTDESQSLISPHEQQLDVEVSSDDSMSFQEEDTQAFTSTRITVNVGHTEFELYHGQDRESSLARLEVSGLWVAYRSSSNGESCVLLTLPLMSIYDNRPDTKPEMRLMLGPCMDLGKAVMICSNQDPEVAAKPDNALLSMFVVDMQMGQSGTSILMRIQRPRILVVLDFLLAVAQFFVGSWRDERSVEDDPLWTQEDIRLQEPLFKQSSPVVCLGPMKQLIVDAPDVDDFIYDGQSNTLVLPPVEASDGAPLIIVASQKRLRFMNVHIKNALFLDKYIHLGSNSSYSAAAEDGVVTMDPPFADDDEAGVEVCSEDLKSGGVQNQEESSDFAIDVQAVAPELTFYDDTKWPEGSAFRPERLLRAKMDFHMMYAGKGNGLWLAVRVKGLAVEGSSGLMVVEPFDANADYAFADGKTEMNVTCGEIVVRLSFKVMALIRQLHENLMMSVFTGSAQLVQLCSHFDRIWVKETGDQDGQGVAMWRPKAPRGFVVVGDCATSGNMPPAQSVIAISASFRRVSRPVGFDLVWSSSGDMSIPNASGVDQIQESVEGASTQGSAASGAEEFRIWLPIAPPGYAALGCVCERGKLPPSTTTIYCVRTDLLTSTVVSDCVYYIHSDDGDNIPLAIWRIDNSVGTFFATTGFSSAPRSVARDVSEVLRFRRMFGLEGGRPNENEGQTTPGEKVPSSGPRLDSLLHTELYTSVGKFDRVWWNQGGESRRPVSVWRPSPPPGYCSLGDIAVKGYEPPACGLAILDDDSGIVARPERFILRARLQGKKEASVWYPRAPQGYVALGCIVVQGFYPPSPDIVRCVRQDLVDLASYDESPIWTSKASKRGPYISFWKVQNQAQTFLCVPDDSSLRRQVPRKPPPSLACDLKGLEAEQLPDNLSVNVHVDRLSCTLFDNFAGTMLPLVEATAGNLYASSVGRMETPIAVAMVWLSASTFNNNLGVWEPFVEPFEGLLKYESNTDAGNITGGSTIGINASNVVNVNLACAGVNTLINAYAALLKNAKLEEIAKKQLSRVTKNAKDEDRNEQALVQKLTRSALDEENLLKVVVINHTGADLFLRTADNFSEVQSISPNEELPVHVPPPTFPQATLPKSEQSRQFLAVRVVQGKRLPVPSGEVTGVEYLCTLRLNLDKLQTKEYEKTLPQIARTRSIRSCIGMQEGQCQPSQAVWNEVFIFEIPHEGEASLEVVVINQAANGGQGVPIGEAIIPIREGTTTEGRRWSSLKDLLARGTEIDWRTVPHDDYSLSPLSPSSSEVGEEHDRGRYTSKPNGEAKNLGYVTVGQCVFSIGPKLDFHQIIKRKPSFNDEREQGSIQVSTRSSGPWTGFKSNFAFTTIAKTVNGVNLAVFVQHKQTYKCLEFRSLAVLQNSCNIPLDVSLCHRWLAEADDKEIESKPGEEVEEEMFENQRYSLLGGWGSKWPGHLLPTDPGRFSNRDNSRYSQTMLQIPLPRGWKWSSDWQIDKQAYVDKDGWYYGKDFGNMPWPPPSPRSRTRGPLDLVRRMRRVRKRVRELDASAMGRRLLGVLQPGGRMVFPWQAMEPDSDFCVQVRPHVPTMDGVLWNWGRARLAGDTSYPRSSDEESDKRESFQEKVTASLFMLSHLTTTQELLVCVPMRSSSSPRPSMEESMWLCMESSVSPLPSDSVSAVNDWQLIVRPPLIIENLLPLRAEFKVYEKASMVSKPVLRLHQVAVSGQGVHVYTADIRKPVLLRCVPDGGWKPEKEAVLIFDLVSGLPPSFMLLNQYSSRKLRVLIERDRGDTERSPIIVRLSVPYWLTNATGLTLAYRIVEVEPAGELKSPDSLWLAKAEKASKKAKRLGVDGKGGERSAVPLRTLEELEDTPNGEPIMLSIHNLDRIGLSVAMTRSGAFNSAIPFKEFDETADPIKIEAMDPKGHYVQLSATVDMSSAGNERTKVIKLLPCTLFLNRVGKMLILRQELMKNEVVIDQNGGGKPMKWESSQGDLGIAHQEELLQIRTEDSDWSQPFGVDMEGSVHVRVRAMANGRRETIRADVMKGSLRSNMVVVFRRPTVQGPYRIENRTAMLPIRFKQAQTDEDSWHIVIPGSTSSFAWEDLRKRQALEIMVDGTKQSFMGVYDIDKPGVYTPMSSSRVVSALRLCIFEELGVKVVRLEDLKPADSETTSIIPRGSFHRPSMSEIMIPTTSARFAYPETGPQSPEGITPSNTNAKRTMTAKKFNMVIKMEDFGISIINDKLQELLYISMQTATLSFMTGLGEGINRIKFKLSRLQIDNQLPETSKPVLLAPYFYGRGKEAPSSRSDIVMKFIVTRVEDENSKVEVYPHIGIQCFCDQWLLNIHEPILWRLQDYYNQLDFSQLSLQDESQTVSVDPYVRIGLLILSEIPIRVSLAMAPSLRPRGVLGFWAKLASSISNTNNLSIKLHGRMKENICMRKSEVLSSTLRNVRNDLLSQPFQLLWGLSVLGNVSTALGQMSEEMAALSMDKKFLRSREKESKQPVEDIGDGLLEGGQALFKGVFRGVSGLVLKPLEGAKDGGVEGFVHGVGKGIIGAAVQPVSGVLDLLSKTTDGVNATKLKLAAMVKAEQEVPLHGKEQQQQQQQYRSEEEEEFVIECTETSQI